MATTGQRTAKSAAKTADKTARKTAAKAGAKAPAKRAAHHHPSDPEHYTDPALRDRLKDEILAGDKGGRPGQWSARKAQLLAHAYEAAGGGYKGEKSPEQRHLHEWTEEEWTTADGKPAIRGETTARYLPKKAWEELTPAERRATDKKKREGSKSGRQFVANTDAAAEARRDATHHDAPARAASRPAAKKAAAKRPAAKAPAKRAAAKKTAAKTAAKRPAAKRARS